MPRHKPLKMHDCDGRFFFVNPSGSKPWRWRYGVNGKENLMAFVEYPVVNLAESRELPVVHGQISTPCWYCSAANMK